MSYRAHLDWLNFLLADVRGGLGPYVNVFLLTQAHWDQQTIGLVLSVSGLVGIALHTPIGAAIDATRHKRGLLVVGVFLLSLSAVAIAVSPGIPVVMAADVTMAALGAVFAPTVASITLGIVGYKALPLHIGRNALFDRAGNLFIAAVASMVGTVFGQRGVFYAVPFFAALATIAILSIPRQVIDHSRARGLELAGHPGLAVPWREFIKRRDFIVLAVGAALFHFANAPMLVLAAQKMALAAPGFESATTSAAIMVAQAATIPMAFLVMRAEQFGFKLLLLVAFGAVPLRGMLFALIDNPVALIGVQVLDGVGAGLFDALVPILLANALRGSGRYSVGRGILSTVQGLGAAGSYAFSGWIVVNVGYSTAFLIQTSVGVGALILMMLASPSGKAS